MTFSENRRFEWMALLEGLSCALLFGVAMPLKYLAGVPEPTRLLGLVHGLAFLAYQATLIDVASERRWPARETWLGALAGIVPFATFAFVARLRQRAPSRRERG